MSRESGGSQLNLHTNYKTQHSISRGPSLGKKDRDTFKNTFKGLLLLAALSLPGGARGAGGLLTCNEQGKYRYDNSFSIYRFLCKEQSGLQPSARLVLDGDPGRRPPETILLLLCGH